MVRITAGANNRDSTATVIKQEHKGKSSTRFRGECSDKESDLDEPPVKSSRTGRVAAADTKKAHKKISAIAAVTASRTTPRNNIQFTTK